MRIQEELTELVRSRSIYEEVAAIISENPPIDCGNRFYTWISKNFCDSLLLGIRRQLDEDPRSVSLMNLLQGIRQANNLLSISFHRTLYRPEMVHLAEKSFEQAIGCSSSYIPASVVEADITELKNVAGVHRQYINKHVAHSDKGQAAVKAGTYGDLYAAVDSMERTFSKYYLLLYAADFRSLLPAVQYDWKSIFRVPWIPEEAT